MCGIIGILTKNKNLDIYNTILEGLTQLQNRGYDSSGMALLNKETNKFMRFREITTKKTSLEKLVEEKNNNLKTVNLNTNVGIGHNRWATHGAKTVTNAHPHECNTGKFMIVHNGIIENYAELKKFLLDNHYSFNSETDTEVIVNLINYFSEIKKITPTSEAIRQSVHLLRGTYGLVILKSDEPNSLYAVRNGSPLLIGSTDEYVIVTSEQSGFCNKVNNYIILKTDDVCSIKINNDNKINIDTTHEYDNKSIIENNYDLTPSPYKYWIEKEINDQPETVLKALNMGGRIKNSSEVKLGGLEQYTEKLRQINNIIVLGCGTSYHSGLYGSHFFKKLCNFDTVQVIDGADFSTHDIPKKGNTALILLSQSGETRDLYRCIEISKETNVITIGVINVVESLIAREVDCGVYCNAGREMSVASTKVFTSQVVCLTLMAIWFSQIHNINEMKRVKIIQDLHNLSGDLKDTIEKTNSQIEKISQHFTNTETNLNNMFILGKSVDEYIAREGSLKIKEISYVHSEAYSLSSLKHGPFALLDEKFPVIIISTIETFVPKVNNCIEEIVSRKSPIFLITDNCYKDDIERKSYSKTTQIEISHNTSFSSLLAIIPLQLLAFYISVGRNINPDIPKNLAKVVTVE